MPDQQFKALQRMVTFLEEKGLDSETVAYIVGKMMRLVVTAVSKTLAEVLGEETLLKFEQSSDEEKSREINRLYQEKTGKTVAQLREEYTEKLVAEFEAA